MHKIAEGLWQLAGFPPNLFNVYLAGDILIDAATRWAAPRIFRQVRSRTAREVALTHCHPDHQGSAAALCKRLGVPLACHRDDQAAAEGHEPMMPQHWMLKVSNRLWGGPPYPVGNLLQEGDQVGEFRVIHAPGHTPGHVIFFRDTDRVVVGGDVLFNLNPSTGLPGLHEPPEPFSTDPAENRRSIKKLLALRPKIVCFGHGPPLRDLRVLERFVARMNSKAV
jgi:glyoxylase-like metal-dependent hydrolase (beta-lactamase superfamily II)